MEGLLYDQLLNSTMMVNNIRIVTIYGVRDI
jgi:hypothetical protein